MPKPIVGDNGRHARSPVGVERRQRTCSPAMATPACPNSRCTSIGGIIKHARALNAITNLGTKQLQTSGPWLKAPVHWLKHSARNRSA